MSPAAALVRAGVVLRAAELAGGDPLVLRAFAVWGRLPSVPVRVVDPADVYRQPRTITPPMAFVLNAHDTIYVSRRGSAYRRGRPELLASVLAHEQAHLDGADSEEAAYRVQLALVERLVHAHQWSDRRYLELLRRWVR